MRTDHLLKNLANTGVTREQMRTAVVKTLMETVEFQAEVMVNKAYSEYEPVTIDDFARRDRVNKR